MIQARTVKSLMEEVYTRISENRPYDKNLKPLQYELVTTALEHFELEEEFEKCQKIKEFLTKNFTHGNDYLK